MNSEWCNRGSGAKYKMEEDIIKLENASSLILSPPNKVSASQRGEAEAIFFQLKRLPRPYSFCQLVLDSNASDYVKFQAVCTMKEALSREWSALTSEEKVSIKQHTLDYLMTKHNVIPKYVRCHLTVLLILVIKRGIMDQGGQQTLDMFIDQMSHLLMEPSQMELGCCVLNTLLTEFSNASGSSAIGMPLEFHLRAKKVLEQNGGLLKIFNISVQILQLYTNDGRLTDTERVSILVSLSLQVLSWDFRSSYLYHLSSLTSSIGVPFKPSQDFSTILLNPSLLQLYMTIFSKTLSSSDMVLLVGQCLSQLASLSGPVFSSEQDKASYVINYTRGLLASINESTDAISVTVVYHLSQCCRHLVTSFTRDCFLSLGEELLTSFVQMITHFVQFVCQRTATPTEDDDQLATCEESLCLLLEVIVRLLEGPRDAMHKFLLPSASNLFTVYLQSKLSPPLGTKKCETFKEVNVDLEEDDRNAYEDELSYIGAISRAIPHHSLPQLLSALQRSISQCSDLLQVFIKDQGAISSNIDYLECQYENTHWLLMVATYTVADVVTSEESIIPVEIMDYSRALETTPMGVAFGDAVLSGNILSDESVLMSMDPVVCLVACICCWCVVERRAAENGLKDIVSPQTSETAVWSLTNILSPYLMMEEKCYDQLSMSLVEVFGCDTDNGKWILSFVLDKILFNLSVWHNEERLMACTLKMLSGLATTNKRRSQYLISTDQLWHLMRAFASGQHPFNSLAPGVQKEVVAGLLACATGPQKDQYLNELVTPLSSRFHSLVLMEDFPSRCKDDSLRVPLVSVLESLSAIALSTQTSMVDDLFAFLLPILRVCVQLFHLFVGYQDMTLCILRLFLNVAEMFTIFLDDNDSRQLYEVSLTLIDAYSKHHTSKYLKGVLGEEEECDDLVMFIQILSFLTTKDYLDFSSDTSTNPSVRPVEVVMKGLVIVLPFISEELLKYPDLCKNFYELLHYVCEIFPEGIAMLNEETFHQMSKLIDMGCTRYGSDVCKLCVENIESIASSSECGRLPIVVTLYQHFLKSMFEHIISVDFDTSMLNTYAGAIFQLICALKDHHDELLQALLSACITDADKIHLQSTVQQLVSTVSLDGTRASKDKFRKNLKDHLPTLRGYLCVK